MANFNFDFEKYYRPILEQSTAVGDATNQLTGFQQGQGTAMMDLQKMMQEVSGGYKKAQEAKTAAVQAVAGGSGQYAQALPDTINPMARQQLAQGRWAQDVAQMSGANETLAGLRQGDQDRLSNAMQFRNAEEARLAGAVQAQKDRYTMLQNEFDRAYQMETDKYTRDTTSENEAWNRQMEQKKLAQSGSSQALQREMFLYQKEQDAKNAMAKDTNDAWELLKQEAADNISLAKQTGTWMNPATQQLEEIPQADMDEQSMFQDYIYRSLNSNPFASNPNVDVNTLWNKWNGLPGVNEIIDRNKQLGLYGSRENEMNAIKNQWELYPEDQSLLDRYTQLMMQR